MTVRLAFLLLALGLVPAVGCTPMSSEGIGVEVPSWTLESATGEDGAFEVVYRARCQAVGREVLTSAVLLLAAGEATVVDGLAQCGPIEAGGEVDAGDGITLLQSSPDALDPADFDFATVVVGRDDELPSTRQTSTIEQFTYPVQLASTADEAIVLSAMAMSAAPATRVVVGLTVAETPPGGSVGTAGILSLQHDLAVPFDPAAIHWSLRSETAQDLAVGVTTSLDGVGHPLGGVRVEEQGPEGDAVRTTEASTGFVSLAQSAGDFRWRFSKEGHLPVWRRLTLAAGEVAAVHAPWLARQDSERYPVTVLNGGVVGGPAARTTVTFGAGTVSANLEAVLTELDGQALPAALPIGWSPLNAFWLELAEDPSEAATGALQLLDALEPGEAGAFARFAPDAFAWQVLEVVGGDGGDAVDVAVPGAGAYVFAVADVLPAAPPAPEVGLPLGPAAATFPEPGELEGEGAVDPAVRAASLLPEHVTGLGRVEISHEDPLASGLLLRGEVDEHYRFFDGEERRTPRYPISVVAYQRPGDRDPRTLEATFPLRPTALFGPTELAEATLQVEILPPSAFAGAVLGDSGGLVVSAQAAALVPADVLAGDTPVELRDLEAGAFGPDAVLAFDLSVGGVVSGQRFEWLLGRGEPGAHYVLAAAVSRFGLSGLEPLERYRADETGLIVRDEPVSGGLPGVRGPGRLVLVRVDGPQAIVEGTVRDTDGIARPGLAVQIAGTPWLTFSDATGGYQLVAGIGPREVVVIDPGNGDLGTAGLEVPASLAAVGVDAATAPTGPRIVERIPADGERGVDAVTPVVVRFSEAVARASFGTDGLVLLDGSGTPVDGSLSLNLDGNEATFLPVSPLVYGSVHTLVVSGALQDEIGLPIEGDEAFRTSTFTIQAAPTRGEGAQLAIYEPGSTLGYAACDAAGVAGMEFVPETFICVLGSQGAADPEVPVVLANDSTGATATTDSDPDGSFAGVLEATVDDFVSATFVNGNGTRIRIPVQRQLFDDGSVALYAAGGILEAENEEAGVVQVLVEPNAIPNKSKFKLDLFDDFAQLLEAVENTPPEDGQLLGGFEIEFSGDPLEEAADFTFPVDPADLDLEPGQTVEDRSFILAEPIEVDGTLVYRTVDAMKWDPETQTLFTSSPPFDAFLGFGRFLLTPLMLPVFKDNELTMTGRVVAAPEEIANELTEEQIRFALPPIRPVPGAIVTADIGGFSQNNAGLRAGAIVARANSRGFFALRVPFNPFTGDPVFLRAQSPLYPGRRATDGSVAPTIFNGIPEKVRNLVFSMPENASADGFAPLVTASPETSVLPVGEDVTVYMTIQDDRSAPYLNGIALDPTRSISLVPGQALGPVLVSQGASTPITPTSIGAEVTVQVERSSLVTLLATAVDQAGNERVVPFRLRFGVPPEAPPTDLQPYDDDDATPPRVVSVTPGRGVMLAALDEIVIRFSEAVSESIETDSVSLQPSGLSIIDPIVELSDDHLTAVIYPSGLPPGTEVTLAVDAQDLAGNAMDTFSTSFRTAPSETAQLQGVDWPVATVVSGAFAYTLDRGVGDGAEGIVVHDLGNLSQNPTPAGFFGLPEAPRTLTLLTPWSFKTGPTEPTRTASLLVATGGVLGEGNAGQWMWVIDVSDPASPQRVAGGLVSIDVASAVTNVRWSAPRVALGLNTPEGGRILHIDLQAFILGSNGTHQTGSPSPGNDDNADGDYVDSGDTLPTPQFGTLWGHDFTTAAAFKRIFRDFDLAFGGLLVASAMPTRPETSSGGPGGPLPELKGRLQIHSFNGLPVGNGDGAEGGLEFDEDPWRVRLDPSFPVTDDTGLRIVPVALVSYGAKIGVVELTDPFEPELLHEVFLGPDVSKIFSIERADADTYAVGTQEGVFLLDREELGEEADSTTLPHHAVQARLPTPFGSGRTFGASSTAVAVPGGQVARRPPAIAVARSIGESVPSRTDVLGLALEERRAFAENLVETSLLFPASLTPSDPAAPGALSDPPSPANHYYALVRASGTLGEELSVAVEALGVDGKLLSPRGTSFPPVMLSDETFALGLADFQNSGAGALRASRLSSDPTDPLYDLYVSDPFLVLREALSDEQFEALEQGGERWRQVIWSGDAMRFSLDAFQAEAGDAWLESLQSDIQSAEYIPGLSRRYAAFCGQYVDSPNPLAERSSPHVAGVNTQSGEFRHAIADAQLQSHSVPLGLTRTYESRSLYVGPFGRGWDSNVHARLCSLPTTGLPSEFTLPLTVAGDPAVDRIARPGDVLVIDGAGSVQLYPRIDSLHGNVDQRPAYEADPAIATFGWTGKIGSYYASPPGHFETLMRFTDGSFVLLQTNGERIHFGADGRIDQVIGTFPSARTRYRYRADGRLDEVENDRGQKIEFGYYERSTSPNFMLLDRPYGEVSQIGLIARVKTPWDDTDYHYDELNNLVEVDSDEGTSRFYGYDDEAPYQMTSIRHGSADGEAVQTIGYGDGGLVETVSLLGETTTFSGAAATARDRLEGGDGTTSFTVGDGEPQQIEVDSRGRPTDFAGQAVEIGEASGQIEASGTPDEPVELEYDTANPVHRFRGHLRFIRTPGAVAEIEYDGSAWNRVSKRTSAEGVETLYAYSPSDQSGLDATDPIEITRTSGPVINRDRFDGRGRLLSQELSEGDTTFEREILFDADGFPVGERSGSWVTTRVSRDGARPDSVEQTGVAYDVSLNDDGQLDGLTSGQAPDVSRGFDDDGLPNLDTVSADGLSVSDSYEYVPGTTRVDSSTREETGLPAVETTYSYDDEGRLTGWDSAGEETTLTVEGLRVTGVTAPGIERSVVYDDAGRVENVTEQGVSMTLGYDAFGRVNTHTQFGGTTTFTYNDGTEVRTRTLEDETYGVLEDETFGYDGAGRVNTIDALEGQYTYEYFPDGQVRRMMLAGEVLREVTRDAAGRITSVRMPGIERTFSNFNAVSGKPEQEDLVLSGGLATAHTTTWDALGRPETLTDEAGTWSFGWDDFGNPTSHTDPDGVTHGFAYSPQGLPLGQTFSDGTGVDFSYVGNTRVESHGDMSYVLGDDGMPDSVTYPDGSVVEFNHVNDPFEPDEIVLGGVARRIERTHGRVSRIDVPATSEAIDFQRDALGRPRSLVRTGVGPTETLTLAYDDFGSLTEEVGSLGTWSHAVTATGKLDTESYPSGLALSYEPDDNGFPTTVSGAGIESVGWHGPARVQEIAYEDGVTLRHELDASLRIERIVYEVPGEDPEDDPSVVAGFEYVFSPGGRVLSEHRPHEGRFDVYERSTPETGMRVTGFRLSAADAQGTAPLAEVTGFDFDGNGEITPPTTAAGDARGQFPGFVPAADGYRLESLDGVTVLYDAAGRVEATPLWVRLPNQSALTRVVGTLTYDGFGLLARVERDDGCTVVYRRDGWGRIVERTVTGPEARCRNARRAYVWRAQQLIEEYEEVDAALVPIRRYVYLGDRLVRVEAAPAPGAALAEFVPLVNLLGSVGGYLAPDGTLVEAITYGPYGLPVVRGAAGAELSGSAIGDTLLFQSAWFDPATGLYQMGERNLHPLAGRFLQRDGAIYVSSRALATAFNGDPATNIDRDGAVAVPAVDLAKNALRELAATPFKDIDTTVNSTLSTLTAYEGAGKALADTRIGGSKAVAGLAVAGAVIGYVELGSKLFPSQRKAIAKNAIEPWKKVKAVADIAKGFHDLREQRLLQTAIRAGLTSPRDFNARMRWLSAGGANASFNRLTTSFWSKVPLREFRGDAEGLAKARAGAVLNYRNQRSATILGITKGVFDLVKGHLERTHKSRMATDRTSRNVMGTVMIVDGWLNVTEAVLAARTSSDAMRFAAMTSGAGSAATATALRSFAVVANVQLAYNGGNKIGQGIVFLVTEDDVYREYKRQVDLYNKNGGLLTVFSGGLMTVGLDEAAHTIQQFQDANHQLPNLREAWDTQLRDYEVRSLYLSGLDYE